MHVPASKNNPTIKKKMHPRT